MLKIDNLHTDDCLYELLEKSEEIQMTNYQSAALKWAIFELESKYCVEE